ncbi:uncharacterized protein LOC131223982 [Magnolia sinica]|uniref:uncharacterized protein LOC131223982 n=1 Tax=Magnolia sinica TaxID=86752 RepID=UPI002659EE6E|nr:uncharacterized protein LOC131223982 [Magnolia sinica]
MEVEESHRSSHDRHSYLFGEITMQLKLIPGNSAGTVTAFYGRSSRRAMDLNLTFSLPANPLTSVDDIRVEEKEVIVEAAISHFRSLLSSAPHRRPGIDNLQLNSISPEDASSLEAPFSSEEVKLAIDSLGVDKAPGPDGFPILFFQIF